MIKKANAKARKRSVTSWDKSATSPSKSASQPTTLTWSSSESTSKPGLKGRPRGDSSSTSSASPTADSPSGSPPSAYVSTFQLSPAPKAELDCTKHVKQEPETPSCPAPIPSSYSPSFEDRGLNLFITRYINVVRTNNPPPPAFPHSPILMIRRVDLGPTADVSVYSRPTRAKTNLTCE